MSSDTNRQRIRSLGGDGFEVIRPAKQTDDLSSSSSSNPSSSLSRARFGSLGTTMRSYTDSDTMQRNEEDAHKDQTLTEFDDKTSRSSSPFFGRPAIPRRTGRHSFSVLSSPTNTPLAPTSTSSESPKKVRRSSRLLNALTVSLAKANLHSTSRPSSSYDSSSIEHREEASAVEVNETYKDNQSSSFGFARDAGAYADDKAPMSSASAYQQNEESPVQSSGSKLPTKRARRLSIDLLTRRWSTAHLSDPSSVSPSSGLASASNGDTPSDQISRKSQGTVAEAGQGSFNLHSFRKLRQDSSTSYDVSPGHQLGSSVAYSTDALSSSVRVNGLEHTSLHGTTTPFEQCASPVSLSKPTSPVGSQPGSPRLEYGRASTGGSMSAGKFLRAAARSRPDLSISTAIAADERGADSVPPSPSGSAVAAAAAAAKPMSPYRPMTPLGQGTNSPAEELALLEADLARARQHSLAYLAEMEEKEARRQERRHQLRQHSYSSNDALGVYDHRVSSPEPTSYFPAFGDHNNNSDDNFRRAQSPRLYTSETLLDKLARLEQQVFQGQVRSPSHSQRRLE